MKKWIALALAAVLCANLAACSPGSIFGLTDGTESPVGAEVQSSMFTDRDLDASYSDCAAITLSDSGISADAAGVTVDGSRVIINRAGTYLLTGTLSDGQIVVAAGDDDKVQLVLSGVNVTSLTTAALYIKSGDKVFLTLAEGTENSFVSTSGFASPEDGNVDAAIFAKSDITINGTGSLNATCDNSHGIVTKDDLKITSGTVSVTAAKQALSGKDSVRICGGSITAESGTDAIKSTNADNAEKGFVYISGGEIVLSAQGDGISAETSVTVEAGSIAITTGSGSAAITHQDEGFGGWGGRGWGNTGTTSVTSSVSRKGIKGGTAVTISGGSFTMDTEDDCLHTNGALVVSGGSFTLSSGDDGLHADETLVISGGKIDIVKCYEGIESADITICGGDISLVSSDDGLNAAGGADSSGMGGFWGRDSFGSGVSANILISGGTLYVNAEGDGLDSNGTMSITGGTVYVDGPTIGNNGALDSESGSVISGGTVIALGASGMATGFGASSTQGSILYNLPSPQSAGTKVSISDAKGKELASFTSGKSFQSVAISAPGMVSGGTYTLTVGTDRYEITLNGTVYQNGGMGGFGGMGGHGGMGGRGDRDFFGGQEGQTPPDGQMPGGQRGEGSFGGDFGGQPPQDGGNPPDNQNPGFPGGFGGPGGPGRPGEA